MRNEYSKVGIKAPDQTIGHNCGVVGALATCEAASLEGERFFDLLSQVQHRGQQGAGVAALSTEGAFFVQKGAGLIGAALSNLDPSQICGSVVAIGHTRYSTTGGNNIENFQPLVTELAGGLRLALAHNGNIPDVEQQKVQHGVATYAYQGEVDSEMLVALIHKEWESEVDKDKTSAIPVLERALCKVPGAFSLVMLFGNSLVLVRDTKGIRPLVYGMQEGIIYAASETCALAKMGVANITEVAPGEVVQFFPNGEQRRGRLGSADPQQCSFELVYIADPSSVVFGRQIRQFRYQLGVQLARELSISADLVSGVPRSGDVFAQGFASESGIPLSTDVIVRNPGYGRSFMAEDTASRVQLAEQKFQYRSDAITGRSILVIDDSLVRGNTMRVLSAQLHKLEAAAVHLAIASPQIHFPCFFGVDMPSHTELFANHHQTELEMAEALGVESVHFLSLEGFATVLGAEVFCKACFDGNYPDFGAQWSPH